MIWRVKLLHHQVGSRFCKGWKGLGVAGKLLVKRKKKKKFTETGRVGVATSSWCRDVQLVSRPGLEGVGIATWG